MARTPKEDYVPLMLAIARRKLEAGDEVRIADVAAELDVSPSLVNFYFGDRKNLVDAAWRSVFEAYVSDDLVRVGEYAGTTDWQGLRALIGQVFHADRDTVHLTHTRAAVDARSNDELAGLMSEVHDATIDQWRTLLEKSIALGTVSTALDHDAIARLVVAVPMGITIVSPEMTDEQRRAVADTWYAMIRAALDPEFDASSGADEP